jgi:hypothetical protein
MKRIILLCSLLVLEAPLKDLYSQNVQTIPARQSAIDAYSQGKFEIAYKSFRELLLTYPKDPLYKYYSGVCLVKLNRNPVEATGLLQEALQGDGIVKTLPSDGLFFLGRAQQMSGQFSKATETYNLYTDKVGKKVAKEMDVPGFIEQCLKNEGKIIENKPVPVEIKPNEKSDANMTKSYPVKMETVQKSSEKADEAGIATNLPANYDIIMGEAVEYQFKADSVSSIVKEKKKEMDKLSGTEVTSLKAKITEYENIAASYQSGANLKYHQAHILMNPEQNFSNFKKDSVISSGNKIVNDTTTRKAESVVAKAADKTSESIVPPLKTQIDVLVFFEVLTKQETESIVKIPIDPEVPDGLIYRIQVAVFRNMISPSYFKGISPVYGFKAEGTDKTIYYAGMFRRAADASKALGTVRSKGFKDAFVVSFSGNQRVSSDRAASLEKEWGSRPFYTIEKPLPETKADTITPTLNFRVEVTRSSRPLSLDVVDGIKKIAGNKGMDIQQLDDGKIVYLIGKFITFESAAEYADLLKRNGYKEAQVGAWLGKKQIPVDTARQLLDNLK